MKGRVATFVEICEEVFANSKTTPPKEPPQTFTVETIKWQIGDKFNYRIFAALLLIDPAEARTYFRTTS